jgi:hypothetical protein
MKWTDLLQRHAFDAADLKRLKARPQQQYMPDALLRYVVLCAESMDDRMFLAFFATACLIYHADRRTHASFHRWLDLHTFRPDPALVHRVDALLDAAPKPPRTRPPSNPCIGYINNQGYLLCPFNNKSQHDQCAECAARHTEPAHRSTAPAGDHMCLICHDLVEDELFVMCSHSTSRAHLRCAHLNVYKCLINEKKCKALFFR